VKKKILTIMVALLLVANSSMAYATTKSSGKSTGSAPSTSVRSGTFSTSPGSSSKTSPSTSTSPGSGSSSKSTTSGSTSQGSSSPSSSVNPSPSSGFSGGASNKSTVPSTSSSSNDVTKNGSTYSTGAQRPSNAVDGSRVSPYSGKTYYGGSTYSNSPPPSYRTSHFWPVVGAFAAGTMLGSMIHPWGGYYPQNGGGYVHQPFSFLTLFLDVIIILFIIWLLVFVFRLIVRRR
jgi:hypothetical protein